LHYRSVMEESTQQAYAPVGEITDRRETNRFPVREEIKYTVFHSKGHKTSGLGKTLNFSSGGLLFTTEDQLPVGRTVELSVSWPVLLGGRCPLQFVAVGRVVRSESNRAAVKIERYEFRTRGAGAVVTSVTAQTAL
jgi:PilZ domain